MTQVDHPPSVRSDNEVAYGQPRSGSNDLSTYTNTWPLDEVGTLVSLETVTLLLILIP